MAKNSVIVRRLNALEALGGVTYVRFVERVGFILTLLAGTFVPIRLVL